MTAVQRVLKSYGIKASETALARVMEAALQESGFRPPRPAPRKLLRAEEVEVLEKGGFDLDRLDLGADDPVVRTAAELAVLRATALTTQQAARRLGVNDSRVRQRLGQRTLYGIKLGEAWRLPLFQFAPDGLVPGIERVIHALAAGLSPVAVNRWFHTPNPDLADPKKQTRWLAPLDWLRTGNDPAVAAALAADL